MGDSISYLDNLLVFIKKSLLTINLVHLITHPKLSAIEGGVW